MRRTLLVSMALLLGCASAWGQAPETLTREERNFAMSHLNATRKKFYDAINGLTEAQWKFKAAPDRWSIAECAEHIALAEDALFVRLTQKVMKAPPAPEKKAELKGKDELVIKFVTDRSNKQQAPESLRPSSRWSTPAELFAHFNELRDRTVAYVENTPEDLRAHVMPVPPPLQLVDAYQLILYMSGHSARHTAQIDEVKAAPNYPK